MKVAFIGLGNMGLPMALNLVKKEHEVTGFDLNSDALAAFVQGGGHAASSMPEALKGAACVITMLPASAHVKSAYEGPNGVLRHAAPGALLIDSSTIAPEVAREVAGAAQAAGFDMLDAPVSGGTGGAQAGTLTFMVGGEPAVLDRAYAVLQCMGKNIFHAGGSGAGQAAKVCNNMLLGILMAGTCEALKLGIQNGLDPKVLSDIMAQSSGRNWALEVYNPCPGVMQHVPASRGYTGGFGTDLMLKDLGLAVANAQAMGVSVPMGIQAKALYEEHSASGHGGRDFSSLFSR